MSEDRDPLRAEASRDVSGGCGLRSVVGDDAGVAANAVGIEHACIRAAGQTHERVRGADHRQRAFGRLVRHRDLEVRARGDEGPHDPDDAEVPRVRLRHRPAAEDVGAAGLRRRGVAGLEPDGVAARLEATLLQDVAHAVRDRLCDGTGLALEREVRDEQESRWLVAAGEDRAAGR